MLVNAYLGYACHVTEAIQTVPGTSVVVSIVANMLHYDIIVNRFELQLRYYIHFRTNIIRKGMNPFIPGYESDSTTTVLSKELLASDNSQKLM